MASDPNSSNFSPLFNYQISEKLNDDNYNVWLQQIESVLRAHRLHRFCAAPQIPERFLFEFDCIAGIENPSSFAWELQDQAFLAWLQSSLSLSNLPKVLGYRHTW